MRWFLAVYAVFCLGLAASAYIVFYGFEFEGIPLGVWHKGRDISGMNFQTLQEEVEGLLSRYRGRVFSTRVRERPTDLECGRHWFLLMDKRELWEDYRELTRSVPIFRRILQWVKLDWEEREYHYPLRVDVTRTRETLKAWFRDEVIAENLTQRIEAAFAENMPPSQPLPHKTIRVFHLNQSQKQ